MNDLDGVDDTGPLVGIGEVIIDSGSLRLGQVEVKEVVGRVIDLVLCMSLKRKSLLAIADLDKVCCNDAHTVAISIFFTKRLANTLVVVSWRLAILHELNGSRSNRSSSLRSVIHNSQSPPRVDILDRDGRIDRIVIVGDFL